MQANALEKAGAVATPCLSCHGSVYVETDERGKVQDIYVGEGGTRFTGAQFAEGAAFAEHFAEDDDDAVNLRRRATVWPLLLGALGLLFIAWVASSLVGSKPRPRAPAAEAVTANLTPSVTPAATPTATQANAPLLVLDNLSGLTFADNKAELTEESKLALQEAVELLKKQPKGSLIEIGGHTDTDGSAEQNQQLSLQRAEAVRQYLIKQGLPAAHLKVKGYGATQPLVSNETPLGKAQNRRIEFRLVKKVE